MPIEPGSFSFGVVAGGSVVALINHFLAKSRDVESRQIEYFNYVAGALNSDLVKERGEPSPLTKIDFNPIKSAFDKRTLNSFDSCVAVYHRTRKENLKRDEYGGCYFHDTAPIVAAIDELLKFTVRK